MEETIEIKKLMEILEPFTEYCEEVRGDWSEFDGRSLLNIWNGVLKEIEQNKKKKNERKRNK